VMGAEEDLVSMLSSRTLNAGDGVLFLTAVYLCLPPEGEAQRSGILYIPSFMKQHGVYITSRLKCGGQ
jgi:hypothetical protein